MPAQTPIHAIHPSPLLEQPSRRRRLLMLTGAKVSNGMRLAQKFMQSLWVTTLLCIMYNIPRTVNGSTSQMALFTPLLTTKQQHSLPLQRATTIQLGSSSHRSHVMKSSRDSLHHLNGHKRQRSSQIIMSKIKSPSNSYSQFFKEGILVGIERTSPNSRRISGEVIMDTSIDAIWAILTDYDQLNVHVPNLVESKVISSGGSRLVGSSGGNGLRVHQKGAQRIFGFEFSADVTLEMKEFIHHPSKSDYNEDMKTYSIDFQCVQSQFFSQFDGSWILEEYSHSKTMVRYIVDVMPKGPVPVAALEWRIKEDVPVNLLAVLKAARAASVKKKVGTKSQNVYEPIPDIQQQLPKPKQQQHQNQNHQFQQSASPPQRNNPLQQLAKLATQNIKQTAKLFLPASVISTTEQAISVMYNFVPSTSDRQFISSSSTSLFPSPAGISNFNKSNNDDTDTSSRVRPEDFIDWYQDETMAMYLDTLSNHD